MNEQSPRGCTTVTQEVKTMGTHDTKVKDARSSKRLPLQCSLILANGIQTGEGHILNLSKKGCLVESSLQIKAGDQLQLRFFLPESE